jgi:hypothetical protein
MNILVKNTQTPLSVTFIFSPLSCDRQQKKEAFSFSFCSLEQIIIALWDLSKEILKKHNYLRNKMTPLIMKVFSEKIILR